MYEDAMANDAQVLSDVLDQHHVAPRHIAHLTGIHTSTIYRYLSGEKTLPSAVLAAAFRLTLDPRLLCLITGTEVRMQVTAERVVIVLPNPKTGAPSRE